MLFLIIILVLTACAGYCAINSDKRAAVKAKKPVVKVNVVKPKAKKPVVNNIAKAKPTAKPVAKKVTKKVVKKVVAKKAIKTTKKNKK